MYWRKRGRRYENRAGTEEEPRGHGAEGRSVGNTYQTNNPMQSLPNPHYARFLWEGLLEKTCMSGPPRRTTWRPLAATAAHTVRNVLDERPVVKLLYSEGRAGGRTRMCSSVAFLHRFAINHGSLSRRTTVPTPNGESSNVRAVISFFEHNTLSNFVYLIPFLVLGGAVGPSQCKAVLC